MQGIFEAAKDAGVFLAQLVIAIFFCVKYIRAEIDKNKSDVSNGVREQNEIDLAIMEKMDYYKELLNADRVLLFEFHNGQHYSSHRNALKMSVSYETFRAGLPSVREQCSNLPVAIMPQFIADITNKGKSICVDLEQIKHSMGNTYEFKKALGIKSYYDVAIHDKENNIIGFVAVQWESPMPLEIDETSIQHLAWYLEEQVDNLTKKDREVNSRRYLKRKTLRR